MAEHFIYLDANPIAYALEGPDDLASALKRLFSRFREGRATAITSELTLAEVLPKRKVADRHFLELLVWSKVFELHPVDRDILIETADYRRVVATRQPDGRISMPKLPDAIHVVTAIRSGCDIFVSADTRIKLPENLRLVRPDVTAITELVRELA